MLYISGKGNVGYLATLSEEVELIFPEGEDGHKQLLEFMDTNCIEFRSKAQGESTTWAYHDGSAQSIDWVYTNWGKGDDIHIVTLMGTHTNLMCDLLEEDLDSLDAILASI